MGADVALSGGWSVLDEVTTLWAEHRGLTFPDSLRWLEAPNGDAVPLLDTFMAGCVATYIANRGALDAEQRGILRDCAHDLRSLRRRPRGDGARYLARLLRMADLIEQALDA
ncbi:hypothetical protein [Frankia nepalensis]|uniref:Uncharacterized protein n=1 Tax=Frankia nepalensis TaxID=1836974 RepID=A0A937RE67_9ACTN|nr:hypothetical protein [Frankia nepalensis]MBL7510476.1 hypothetical protein [Frankia nepalensis]MBL7630516.1 hypothetical protein [Frankia nepalensis]